LAGHEVTVLDINIDLFNHFGVDKFTQLQTEYLFGSKENSELDSFVISQLENIKQFGYILISCFSDWEYPMTELISKYCKSNSSAKIVVGGPGVQKKADNMLKNGWIDYYVIGEGEIALKELFAGNDKYPGINKNNPIQIDDIESLPLPNYDFFNLKKYDWLLDDPDVFIYGSRGCVRNCTFCDVASYWPKFRYRSGIGIAEEMIRNYENHGIKKFFFADSLLNGNLKEFKIFLDRLCKFKDSNKFHWGGYAIIRPRAQHPAELFDQIKSAGGHFWSVGVETGVDRIRWEMKKKFTNDDVEWHLEQSQRIGLQNLFLMISTWYSETLEEHEEYLKIFPRWQNYAADGTIFGIAVSPTLSILENTPVRDELLGNDLFLENNSKSAIKTMLWHNKKNESLTIKERFRRSLAILETASEYNWNVANRQTILNELKASIETIYDNNTSSVATSIFG